MSEEELIEALADKEHASWSRWMKYLFDQCELQPDGSLLIPLKFGLRWNRQMALPYADLTEQEKQSDREEVMHILPIIDEYVRAKQGSTNQTDIARRLDKLEQHLSEQGINDLARAIEQRIVSRMKYGRDPQIEVHR